MRITVCFSGQVMQNGTRKTMTGIATERGETATHSMQMLAKQIFNHLFFFGRSSPGRISWPAGWQSDSLARIVSPLPNWPASLCRFQQAKHVPASNLSFVFSFRLLFSSEQVDDGFVSTGREEPLFFLLVGAYHLVWAYFYNLHNYMCDLWI